MRCVQCSVHVSIKRQPPPLCVNQGADVFNKLGVALGEVEGLTIASRAQLLGTYDVTYEGSNFLVRVAAVETGTYVSAVDPRGIPSEGAAPTKLIAALKAKLGG